MKKELSEKRILICSVLCPTSRTGDNTFLELFSSFPPEQLACLYIREELPDDPRCIAYFQVSEQKVLRSLIHPHTETGRLVTPHMTPTEEDEARRRAGETLYTRGRRSGSYHAGQCIREFAWLFGRWKTPALDRFLDSFHPDIVAFDMSNYAHLARMVRYALRRTGAAGVGFIWDDTFTYRQGIRAPGFLLWRCINRHGLKKTARLCHAFCAISEKTKQEADAFFGVDCTVLTKPIRYAPGEVFVPTVPHAPLQLLYTGNLLIGRFDTLVCLSDAVRQINREGKRVEIHVYTATPPEDLDCARLCCDVHIHMSVSQTQALALQREADVLLFLEALKPPEGLISRLSFSTKITDYLHAGKCILAIGLPDVAPMEYLASEGVALCASDTEGIRQALDAVLTKPALLDVYGARAFDCGRSKHGSEQMQRRLDKVLETALTRAGHSLCTKEDG